MKICTEFSKEVNSKNKRSFLNYIEYVLIEYQR